MPRNLKIKQRKKILFLHGRGLNISQISQELNVTRSTVRRWIHRHADGSPIVDRPRAPRPRILTKERVALMANIYREKPFATTVSALAAEYKCSTQTIRKALNSAGVRHIRPSRVEKKKLTGKVNSVQDEEAESSETEMLSDSHVDSSTSQSESSEIETLSDSELDITTSQSELPEIEMTSNNQSPNTSDTSKPFPAKKRHLDATASELSEVLDPLENKASIIKFPREDENNFLDTNVTAQPIEIEILPNIKSDITTSPLPSTSDTSKPFRANKYHLVNATESELSGALDPSTIINTTKENYINFVGVNVAAQPSDIKMLPDSPLGITPSLFPSTSDTSKPSSAKKRLVDATELELSGVLDRLEHISTIINTPREDEDEFHFFGMNVAAHLRRLPLNVAMHMEAEFQYKLYLARVRLQNTGASTTASVAMAPQATERLPETYLQTVKEEVPDPQPDP